MGDSNDPERMRKEFLSELKKEHSHGSVIAQLSNLRGLKVLVIGDTVIDEYDYCDILERAKKEPILVFKHDYLEDYAGGILAIANHVAETCDNVTMLTAIGNDALTEGLITKNLNKKIVRQIFRDSVNSTLVKKRYVHGYRGNKVFEVYNKDPDMISIPEEEIIKYLQDNLGNFDLVIVGDFGHGVVTDKVKNMLSQKAKYLAVNVQTNSGNLGFNLITKFSRADFISLTAEELQLAMHDRKSDLKELVKKLCLQTKCKKILVTMGKGGILYFDNWSFYSVPIFSDKVVDTVGAGDAVFSLTSLLAYKGADPQLVPFLGNCVGGLAVQIMGNKEPVRSERLHAFVTQLFNA